MNLGILLDFFRNVFIVFFFQASFLISSFVLVIYLNSILYHKQFFSSWTVFGSLESLWGNPPGVQFSFKHIFTKHLLCATTRNQPNRAWPCRVYILVEEAWKKKPTQKSLYHHNTEKVLGRRPRAHSDENNWVGAFVRVVRGGLCKGVAFKLRHKTRGDQGRLWSWQGNNLIGVFGSLWSRNI